MTTLTPVQALTAARELLSNKAKWTTRLYAKGMHKESIDPCSEEAVCFCSIGALMRVNNFSKDTYERGMGKLLGEDALHDAVVKMLKEEAPDPEDEINGVVGFNDHYGHAKVLKMFDLAIELAKKD